MAPSRWLHASALIAAGALALPAAAQFQPAETPAPVQPPPAQVQPPPPAYAPPPPAYAPPPQYAAPPPQYAPAPAQYAVPPPQAQPSGPQPRVQLSAFGGYQLNGDVDTYAGHLNIDDDMVYGAAVDFRTRPNESIQLLWLYNSTTAQFQSYDLLYPSSNDFGMDQHYFQIGGTKGIRRGKVEPFGGGTLGALLVLADKIPLKNGGSITPSDTWRFAITMGGGLKVWVAEKVAIRFEARLLLPMYFGDSAVVVGSGGLAVSAGIPSVQGVFTAGLTFAP